MLLSRSVERFDSLDFHPLSLFGYTYRAGGRPSAAASRALDIWNYFLTAIETLVGDEKPPKLAITSWSPSAALSGTYTAI